MTYKQRLHAYAAELYTADCLEKGVPSLDWKHVPHAVKCQWLARAGRWMNCKPGSKNFHPVYANLANTTI